MRRTKIAVNSNKKNRVVYPFSKGGLYMSIVLAVLSVFLALVLLTPDLILLVYYALVTSIITAVVFALKIGMISIYVSRLWKSLTRRTAAQEHKKEAEESPRESTNWRALLLLLALTLAIIFTPIALSQFLNPYVWFMLVISLTSGISFGDISFYLYATR
jgi:hypothetical protein